MNVPLVSTTTIIIRRVTNESNRLRKSLVNDQLELSSTEFELELVQIM